MKHSKLTLDYGMEEASFGDNLKRSLLKIMLESRFGDYREQSQIRQGQGWFQLSSVGHEAMAAVGMHLEKDDYCAPYYRDRAMVLAKGMSSYEIALNFLGKKEASSAGRQLPSHFSDRSKNIWSHASPVGSHLLPACGIAWGLQLDGKRNVVIASLGDASTRQGDFYEAICIAKEKNLPIIFIVEDNKLGVSTSSVKTNPRALGTINAEDWIEVDGANVEEVYVKTGDAIARVRNGGGPAFFWVVLERLDSHSSADDHRNYRDETELEGILERDPLLIFKDRLIQERLITQEEYAELEKDTKKALRNDYLSAQKSPDPLPEDTSLQIFADEKPPEHPPVQLGEKCRMVEAINLTLREAIHKDPDCIIYGQDVEEPKGGVFKLTAGLSSEYPDNVFNAPVAESTIVGLACGLAGYGKRPVFEIQFVDFISPAWNQLISNLATIRWRTNGDWECPVVIYAPCGAYLPGGAIWHSQTYESLFSSIPGVKVVVPSTPEDCVNLFWTSIQSDDPVLVLIPKHLMWIEQVVEVQPQAVSLGISRHVNEGDGISVVTWGNCLELIREASREFDEALLDVIDLRSITPWDVDAVKRSVHKTGKLLIVQEDTPNCSVGQMILAELVQDQHLWKAMKATPILISRENVQIGLNPIYEYAALPDKKRVMDAINTLDSAIVNRDTIMADVVDEGIVSRTVADDVTIEGAAKVAKVHRIQVPILGEGIQTARVVSMIKKQGERVDFDDELCELETDKAVFPIESSVDGKFVRWLIEEDSEVSVGQEIAEIETEEIVEVHTLSSEEPKEVPKSAVEVSRELLTSLIGRVFSSEGERERKSGLSSEIVQAMQGIVPSTITMEANWQSIKVARAKGKKLYGKKAPSPSAMVAWNTVQAMKEHKMFTFTVAMDKLNKDTSEFDLGVAVSLPDDELQTAIVKNANTLSWDDFVDEFVASIGRARRGEFSPKTRAPLLISTMGPFDVRSAIPVVVPPSMATLFVGNAHIEPYVNQSGEHDMREVVNLTLTFDHRWINGVGSAAFLSDVRENIENFQLPV